MFSIIIVIFAGIVNPAKIPELTISFNWKTEEVIEDP
jgi:hypothetical protein